MADIKVKKEKVDKFLKNLFKAAGLSCKDAKLISESLVINSLRGIDSHGIRLVPHYLNAFSIKRIKLKPRFKILKKSANIFLLDADHGHGILAGTLAMKKAIITAKKYGAGIVFVKNSTHFAVAGTYALMAADKGMIGVSMTNTDSLVVPFGGKIPFLGTNPIAFAVPGEGKDNFCLDMATSLSSWNNVMVHRALHKALMPGWAVDKDGIETTSADAAVGLLPIGKYKGYGLGLMIEILCSVVSGMPSGRNINKMYPLDKNKRKLGHFFLAIDISKVVPINIFRKRISKVLKSLRSQPTNKKVETILVAGDRELAALKQRSKDGIPINKVIAEELDQQAAKYNIKSLFK